MSAVLGALAVFGMAVGFALLVAVAAAGLILFGYLIFASWVGSGRDF